MGVVWESGRTCDVYVSSDPVRESEREALRDGPRDALEYADCDEAMLAFRAWEVGFPKRGD